MVAEVELGVGRCRHYHQHQDVLNELNQNYTLHKLYYIITKIQISEFALINLLIAKIEYIRKLLGTISLTLLKKYFTMNFKSAKNINTVF